MDVQLQVFTRLHAKPFLEFVTRGPKDLKINTGSVNFFKPLYMTPPLPLLPKIGMSDQKRQFQEKHIAFLVYKSTKNQNNYIS
jgi:hypothetical protein